MRRRLAVLAAVLPFAAVLPALAQRAPAAPRARAQAPAVALASDTSWVRRSALYEVNVRDFSSTGDFQGVVRGLDRIAATGADVLWLMPIHPVGVVGRKGTLGSPYAARDYHAIDPAFGTLADFQELVQAVHARGMKLILDWVPDHTAPDAVWVTEHPDYYLRDDSGRTIVPRDLAGKPTDWTDVRQLDYGNPALRRAMIAAMRYWLVDQGIDGFRVDVAHFIPGDFWREATTALRAAVRRPILLLAEAGELVMHRNGFDLSYAWDTYARLKAVWRGASADTFVRSELRDMAAMPRGGMRMRFTTNHDETAWDNPPVILFGGSAGARAAYAAIALLPGRPLLYDGQEVESPVRLRLFERDTIDWDRPGADSARAFYRRVVDLARTDSMFLRGDFRLVQTSTPGEVIAYRRGDRVVLVNTRDHGVRVMVTDAEVDRWRDLLTGGLQYGDWVSLPPYGAVVLAPPERAAAP
jgi:glycosidase